MKKIATAALVLAVSLAVSASSGWPFGGARTYEGRGFNTPEAALRAYIEAYRDMDLDAMLSACAVESYAEHYDLEVYTRRIAHYNASNPNVILPNTDPFAKQLNAERVAAGIYGSIYNSVLNFAFFEMSIAGTQGKSIQYLARERPSAAHTEFFAVLDDTAKFQSIQRLTIERILTETDFLSYLPYSSRYANMQRQISKIEDMYGGKLAEIAAIVSIDSELYLLSAYAVEYDGGGKWYIIPARGDFTVIIGLSPYYSAGGLVPIYDEAMNLEAVQWLFTL
ncbi:MAG: hypothetical protein LBJ84_04210 [Oscillospiraceae bacterium]|jgi:hypothetical protein|nr:hypothetical protein [Oscillospiraceae bacterium]